MTRVRLLAIVVSLLFCCVASCSGESRAQVQFAQIVAGCKTALDLTRDAGEAGATNDVEDGCRAALHTWEDSK